jgi:hypothetical protein
MESKQGFERKPNGSKHSERAGRLESRDPFAARDYEPAAPTVEAHPSTHVTSRRRLNDGRALTRLLDCARTAADGRGSIIELIGVWCESDRAMREFE